MDGNKCYLTATIRPFYISERIKKELCNDINNNNLQGNNTEIEQKYHP